MCKDSCQRIPTKPEDYAKAIRLIMQKEGLDAEAVAAKFRSWQVPWPRTAKQIEDFLSDPKEWRMSERKYLNPKVVEAMISAFDDGTIFSVVFEKKDGTLRRMVCRTGVKKHLAGGQATYDPDKNIGVWDTEAPGKHVDDKGNPIQGDYRCFAKDKVLRIKGGGAMIEACLVGEIEDPIVNARGEEVTVK